MRLLVVTPIHNEANNIAVLAGQLENSTRKPDLWVVVDDGSTDHGAELLSPLHLSFPHEVLSRSNDGGLIGGSAFKAWHSGVAWAEAQGSDWDAVMKLDADVELPAQYLGRALEALGGENVGIAGGVLRNRSDREQTIHVPGPVKLYSAAGRRAIADLPLEVGFDVMDELAVKEAGLRVIVDKSLHFDVRRAIGASQGLVHGRRRNGQVCRWTGYWPPYFLLHAVRYAFRRPRVVGSVSMMAGYLRAGSGPYPRSLRLAHAREQRAKLGAAVHSPRRWLKETYGIDS